MRNAVKHASVPRLTVSIAVGAAALAVAACASGPTTQPLTPLSQYVLQVQPGVDRIALAVHEQGLSANQHAALQTLVGRFAEARADVLTVEAPSGDDPVAAGQAYAIRDALQAMGVPGEMIQVVGYHAPSPRAPVLAGFQTVHAYIPDCAAEPRRMEGRASNAATGGFGCSVTANMAAQIADPRDIVSPRAFEPGDSGRSAVVFARYRQGQPTAAPQEAMVDGRISQAVD
jgi:pilus assembly protein CpaD